MTTSPLSTLPGVSTALLLLLLILVLKRTAPVWCSVPGTLGVNWGTCASQPLPPHKVVNLLKSNKIPRVKLPDANPDVLRALSGSGISVTLGIPDDLLPTLNSSLKSAEGWVHDNLTRYVPGVKIQYVAVGNDPFLSINGDRFHPFVLGAAINIQAALVRSNLASRVKVVVPCSYDSFQTESGLPSGGRFRLDINETVGRLLTFHSQHQSPLFASLSPFLSYHLGKNISLELVLFKGDAHPLNDSGATYINALDLSYDTLVSALIHAGFPQMEIVISQIGWPTDGAANATLLIAEDFMKGLVKHVGSNTGSPLRPKNPPVETYVQSLLDEDGRSVVLGNFERHWGLFTFDGQAKYDVDLGMGSEKLVNAHDVEYLPAKWCVVNSDKDLSNATTSAIGACSVADCSVLSPGGSCYGISWPGNVSYAFNSYFQQQDQRADSCYFGGLGLITKVDPSVGSCRFSVGLQTSSSTATTTTSITPCLMLAVSCFLVRILSFAIWKISP
ncbi:hypothetical protein MLD38_008409 [Melastoma candidum]|uniref:Uncharacterized protein n=1 Tax=Melastoma candidum TaxID=119954 RepID=A0ACB9RUR2_9MYRT|nr:hypothetical protein MLD38_008409 [Melastoma candidum]